MNFDIPNPTSEKKPITNPDQDLENNPEEARELRVLKAKMAHARKTLRGERIFGDTVWEDLQNSLLAIEEGGVDASTLKAEASEMVAQLPGAEISNVLGQAEDYFQTGDIAGAKSWHADAQIRLQGWEQKKAIQADTLVEFKTRLKRLETALYNNTDSQETDHSARNDDNVIDFVAAQANQSRFLSREEFETLESEKDKLSENIKDTFHKLEVLRLQKKSDSILGTKKVKQMEGRANELPWTPYESHMLDMIKRASSTQDLNLIRMNFSESVANITEDMEVQDKALASLKKKLD